MTTATIRSHRHAGHAGLGATGRPAGRVAGRVTRPTGARSAPEPAPNYLVRRLVVAFVALSLLAAGIVAAGEVAGALSDLGGRPAAASEVDPATSSPGQHVAVAGDTLWSIADTYRGSVSRDRYLDALEALNGGTAIQAGQAVRLP